MKVGAQRPHRRPVASKRAIPHRKHDDLRSKVFRDFVAGVALSSLLFGLAYLFNRSQLGEDLSWSTYRFLQRRLTTSSVEAPITVLDIGQLERDSGVTPRPALGCLLTALAKQRPAAIAVDVDFSPEEMETNRFGKPNRWRFVQPDDYKFFDSCLLLKKSLSVPIYLGIYRTRELPPDEWLGLPEYKELAAALLIPKRAKKTLVGTPDRRTLSSALAQAALTKENKREDNPEHRLSLFERVSKLKDPAFEEFLVDYSLLDELKSSAIKVPGDYFNNSARLESLVESRKDAVRGKMVLIGDVQNFTDPFENSSGEDPIPGVLIHASAAYTEAKSPLYDLREPWRLLADLLVAIVILLMISGVRLYFGHRVNEERLLLVLTFIGLTGVILFGITVNVHRVLWDDFLVVAIGIGLDPVAENMFHALGHGVRSWLGSKE